jgi:hypothetical protein
MCLARHHRRRHEQEEQEQVWKNTDANTDAVAATAPGAGAGASLSSSNQDDHDDDDADDPKDTSLIIFNHHDGNSPTSSPPPPTPPPPVPPKQKTLSSLYDQIVDEYDGMNNGLRGEEKKEQEETTLKDLPPDDDNTPEANNGGFWAGLYQSLSRTAQSPLSRKNHDLYPAQNNDDPSPPHLAMTEEGSRAEQDSDLDGMSEWQSSDANADTSSSLGFDAGSRAGGDGESVGASQRPRP